ncbi:NrsF family protein [Sediminicoccus rosea]|uniref:NrsF family protein n=1 Tax=Sediminicoccus rosea TaxID=1225128 RepID=A0ABZ0PM88_9PROT|nr:NrsF family protein [Sediminicoccus rosea]WPB86438.1 NrsF family protein [Sediminicoccus rosea]
MRSEDLIHRLAINLRPVRPASHPALATAVWLTIVAAVIGLAVLVSGPRHDLAERLTDGFDLPQIVTASVTGVLAAFAAFELALPERSRRWALLPLPAAVAWLATMGWGCLQDLARLGPDGLRIGVSVSCMVFIAGLSVPLTVAMLWLARHAARLRAGPVAALGGLSAAAFASVGLSFIHHLDGAAMVLAWHGLSMLVVTLLAALLGPRLMRRARPLG